MLRILNMKKYIHNKLTVTIFVLHETLTRFPLPEIFRKSKQTVLDFSPTSITEDRNEKFAPSSTPAEAYRDILYLGKEWGNEAQCLYLKTKQSSTTVVLAAALTNSLETGLDKSLPSSLNHFFYLPQRKQNCTDGEGFKRLEWTLSWG